MTSRKPKNKITKKAQQDTTGAAQTFRSLLLVLDRNPALPRPDSSPVNKQDNDTPADEE
jgi:hypothetical protein